MLAAELRKQIDEAREHLLKNREERLGKEGLTRDAIQLAHDKRWESLPIYLALGEAIEETRRTEYIEAEIVDDITEGSVRGVCYRTDYEGDKANDTLEFTVDSHYDIVVKLYLSTGAERNHFFVVHSNGDGGCDSTYCKNREEALDAAMNTYGAPHCAEFRSLVDRLLIKDSQITLCY